MAIREARKMMVHIIVDDDLHLDLGRQVAALDYERCFYRSYQGMIAAEPGDGIILAEDMESEGGIAALLDAMTSADITLPVVALAKTVRVRRVVEAISHGAVDYLAPAIENNELKATLEFASLKAKSARLAKNEASNAQARLAKLTSRETDVLDLLVLGRSNKAIAQELDISPRTVEIHRANLMSKLDAKHVADVIRCRLTTLSGMGPIDHSPSRVA